MRPGTQQETDPVHFMSIFEAMSCPVLVLKPDAPFFTILACNKAYAETIHISKDEVIGTSFFDIFPDGAGVQNGENDPRLAASLNIVIEQKQAHTIPLIRYVIKKGTNSTNPTACYWRLHNEPVLDEDGKLLYIVQTATDITKVAHNDLIQYPTRQVAEHESTPAADIAHDASAYYLQSVIDTSQTGIFLFSPVKNEQGDLIDFRFRLANRTLSSYVGQEPEEIIGSLGSTWFPAFKTNGLFDCYAETYLTGRTNRFDFHYNADGIDAWLDILSTRLNDDVLVTFSDYTSFKQLQHKMEQSLGALKRSNNNLEQFAYVASHDLQEPLRKIKSFGDMLSTRYTEQLGPEGADLIERMQGAAGRMKTLIEDLLAFSRISFQESALASVNLNDIIQDVLTDLESSIREKKADITISPMHPLKGDASQLRQVFQNLLSNAIKFGKKNERPEIRITSELVKGADVEGFHLAHDQQKKQFQQIIVRDNGIGFEQQYAERIFQIFQRLHGRMAYPGTGVGLSIVQKVIEHHKGYIRAEGTLGEGAAFTILLPAA